MTPEQQRIKIAETCGWKIAINSPSWSYYRPDGKGWNGDLPDYLNDLNAMHEAEKIMKNRQKAKYQRLISDRPASNLFLQFSAISATAEQKARAFLKVMNLWEE